MGREEGHRMAIDQEERRMGTERVVVRRRETEMAEGHRTATGKEGEGRRRETVREAEHRRVIVREEDQKVEDRQRVVGRSRSPTRLSCRSAAGPGRNPSACRRRRTWP